MNTYFSMVLTLVEDHFSESYKELLRKKLERKEPQPDPMTEVEILRNRFREGILSRKKRKV